MTLKARLAREIALTGPMSVAAYVARCLHDPQDGYYATRPALGEGGDFITAPLVSQMFGELIGLWAVETWRRLGSPDRFSLVEVGPGDGTLMSDALRAARLDPGFLAACDLILIEPSAPLRAIQSRTLAAAPLAPRWIDRIDDIPDAAPVILVANEVLDCMPADQIVKTEDGWADRLVGVDDDGGLVFGLRSRAGGMWVPDIEWNPGEVLEHSEAQAAFAGRLAELVRRRPGVALLIDYGRAELETGDTLQALKRHQKVDPLACPGEADLTQWADFHAIKAVIRDLGAPMTPVITQGDFLRALGIEVRAERLKASALKAGRPEAAPVIDRQLNRLTADDQMGTLFKACAIFSPRDLIVPGFET